MKINPNVLIRKSYAMATTIVMMDRMKKMLVVSSDLHLNDYLLLASHNDNNYDGERKKESRPYFWHSCTWLYLMITG